MATQQIINPVDKQLRGVNLGGWLVLERWMTPSLFEGLKAQDEFSLCNELAGLKNQIYKRHRDSFITQKDFEWIADHGFNAVRLPVGHWLFGVVEPYVESQKYVAKALDWAKTYELAVIIDLHTAPGSQNGALHSGKIGETGWHLNPDNITQTIDTIDRIAKTYGSHKSLYGIELLNEPDRHIPLSVLQDFYRQAYAKVRQHSNCKVIVHDAYRPIAEWQDFITDPQLTDVLLDVHLYQTFGGRDINLTFEEHIIKTLKWKHMIDEFGADKIIVGEWSRVLNDIYNKMDSQSAGLSRKLYTQAQQYAFGTAAGQFYWNYKTEENTDWNYRSLSV